MWLIHISLQVCPKGIHTEDSACLGCFIVGRMVLDVSERLDCFETLGSSHPTAQLHVPEDLNPHQHHCGNFQACSMYICYIYSHYGIVCAMYAVRNRCLYRKINDLMRKVEIVNDNKLPKTVAFKCFSCM